MTGTWAEEVVQKLFFCLNKHAVDSVDVRALCGATNVYRVPNTHNRGQVERGLAAHEQLGFMNFLLRCGELGHA